MCVEVVHEARGSSDGELDAKALRGSARIIPDVAVGDISSVAFATLTLTK